MELPPFFARELLGNSLLHWAIALAGALLAVTVVMLTKRVFVKQGRRIAARTTTRVDNVIVEMVARTGFFFNTLVFLVVLQQLLVLPPEWTEARGWFRLLIVISMVMQLALWANSLVSSIVNRYVHDRTDGDVVGASTIHALGFIGRLFVWVILFMLALSNLGINVTALLTGLGVGGIAVALAVQNILGDLLAAISIILDKPFAVGDFVVVGETRGTVEQIGLQTTRIRSIDGEQVSIPNRELIGSRVRNFKRMLERRVLFAFGVTYDTPPETVERIPAMIRELVEAHPDTRFDRGHFQRFGASSLDFEAVYYVLTPDYARFMAIQQEVNLELLRRFNEQGISFAFPTQTVHLQKS